MQENFVVENFVKLMVMSLQNDTGYSFAKGGHCLYKQEFAALSTVEVIVVVPSELERFCSMLEKRAEDSIHDDMSRRVMTTVVVVPAEKSADDSYSFVGLNEADYKGALLGVKKKCESLGFLMDFALTDFISGSLHVVGAKKLPDKKVWSSLVRFMAENAVAFAGGDKKTTEAVSASDVTAQRLGEKIAEKQRELKNLRVQSGKISEKRFVNPMVLLIIVNVLVFLAGMYFEITTGTDPIKEWGIQDNELIRQGELWRLFTPMFLHADLAHLFGNMLVLLYLGKITLDYYTTREFIAIYTVSGLVGNLLSFFFTEYLSLGASGAIMGLGGMLIYRMFFGKHSKSFRMAGNYAAMVIMTLFNLFYGVFATGSNINNFGHFGGFLGGFVMTALIGRFRKRRKADAK